MTDLTPDMSMFGGGSPNAAASGPDMSMFQTTKPKSQSKLSNIGRGIKGAYDDAVMNNLLVQPVRFAMEKLNYGGYNEKIRQKFPGQTDEWYKKKIHELYTGAVDEARRSARERVENNPYPGHIVPNTIAAIVGSADPSWLIAPGVGLAKGSLQGGAKQVVPKVAKHVAKQSAIQGAIGGATDVAAQGLDIAAGQTRDGQAIEFDPTRTAQSAALGAGFGAGFGGVQIGLAHPKFQETVMNSNAPDFVKGLFLERGRDTTPGSEFNSQVGQQSPALAPENAQRHRAVLMGGTSDEINQFYDELGGARPSSESIDQWVTQRDSMGAPAAPKPGVMEAEIHRNSIQQHIDNQTSTWKNRPDVKLINSVDDIEDDIARQAAIDDGVNPQNTIGFLGADGRVHIFSENIKTPEAANAVLFHEALGHYGLAQRFGSGLDKMLQTLMTRNVGQFGKAVDAWVKNNPKAYGGNKIRAAEEVLAEMSQKGPLKKSLADAIVAHARRFGRQMGLDLKYTDAEINHILAMAHDAVINGHGRDVIANRFGGMRQGETNYQATDFGAETSKAKAVDRGEQLGAEADTLMRDLTWGDNPRDRLIRAQRTLAHAGGDHPEARRIADEAADELGLPRIEDSKIDVQEPELTGDKIDLGVGDDLTPNHPGLDQARIIASAREEAGRNVFMTPQQLQEAISKGDVDIDRLERTYENAFKDYEPTYRPDAEVRRAAVDAGVSPAKVKKIKDMEDLSVRVYRSQKAADVLSDRISGLLEREGTPDWSARDADSLRQALVDHNYILSKLWDDKSEIGRALRVSKMGYTLSEMRAYKELLAEYGENFAGLADDETLNRFARSLKQLMANGQNPNGVNALVKGLSKPHWEDYLTSLHMNMMLSGLSTHIKAPLDMTIGIGRDLLDHAGALPIAAGREALRALGVPLKQGVHPTEVAARMWGIIRSALDASTYANAAKVFVEGAQMNPHGIGGKMSARIPVVSKVTDLIAAQDQFFRAFSQNMHLYGLGVRKAVEEARASGKPMDWDTILAEGSNYARYPSKELLKEVQELAERDLLLNRNPMTAPLDKIKQTTPESSGLQRAVAFVANFLTPFVRVEANSLYNRVWRRTPLAVFDPQTIADFKAGGIRADVAMSRVVMGTAAVALWWEMAGEEKLTGHGPDNPNKRAVMRGAGWRPGAVAEDGQFNTGNKLGQSLNPFDPHNQTATIVAGLREAYDKGANKGQVATGVKLATYSTLKSLADMSWVSDIVPPISALAAPGATMSDKVDQYIADQVATMMPNLTSQAARIRDQSNPLTQVSGNLPETIKNTVQATIPGLREQLPNQMTPFGEPAQGGGSLMNQHTWLPQDNRVTGGNHVDVNPDEAIQEVARLDKLFEESILTPVQRTVKIDGEKIRLTNEEFSEYQRLAGREITETLRDMMGTPEWADMSDEDKAQWIKKMQSERKKAVRGYLFNGDDDE